MKNKWRRRIGDILWQLVTLAILGSCSLSKEDPVSAAQNCESKIRRDVDPVVTKAWATNLLAAHLPGKTNYGGPFEAPTNLKNVWGRRSPTVYVQGGYNGEDPYVRVFWGGGGAGHWGLLIGFEAFNPVESPEQRVPWTNVMY